MRILKILGALLLAALASAGCSNGSAAPGSAEAGAAGQAGIAEAGTAGQAGGSVVPPPLAGIALKVGPAGSTAGTACPIAATSFDVGAPAPTDIDPGTPVANGKAISCSIQNDGNGQFSFFGSVSAVTKDGDPITFDVQMGSTSVSQGSATVSLFAPQLAQTLTSPMPCTIIPNNQQVYGGALTDDAQVKVGAIWAGFSCVMLTAAPSTACAATGTFAFENCQGS